MTESTEKSKKNMKRILLLAVTTTQIVLLVIVATAPSYAYALTIVSTWGLRDQAMVNSMVHQVWI